MTRRSTKSEKVQKFDIHAVASRAKVSIATVSRTVNRVSTVDPKLTQRVWKAIEELNYVPNTQARALVSGRSRILGLIVSEITNPFFPELIGEFERIAVERGYEILIASTSYDRAKMSQCVRRMLERKVDGVAIMTFGIDEGALELFAKEDIPTVFIDAALEHSRSSAIKVNYRKGIDDGVRHLARLGHAAIGFISGPRRLLSASARRKAFTDSMRTAKLRVQKEWVLEGDHTMDGGRDAMKRLLSLPKQPTAILCSNDMTAIGVQHAVFEAGLQIPQDFSLIGFDDIRLAEYMIPPLTTIRMSCTDLAMAAVTHLLAFTEPKSGHPARDEDIATTLVIRGTTGAPRAQ